MDLGGGLGSDCARQKCLRRSGRLSFVPYVSNGGLTMGVSPLLFIAAAAGLVLMTGYKALPPLVANLCPNSFRLWFLDPVVAQRAVGYAPHLSEWSARLNGLG